MTNFECIKCKVEAFLLILKEIGKNSEDGGWLDIKCTHKNHEVCGCKYDKVEIA